MLKNLKFYSKNIFQSFLACLFGILISLILIIFLTERPFHSALDFFTGVFSSTFYIGSFLDTASLLLWASLGAILAFSCGNINLGGEGQIYLSGLVTALILGNSQDVHFAIKIILAFLSACFVGGFCAFIPAILKIFKGSSELLTSFLISSATIPLVDAAISGSFRGETNNLLATNFIPEAFRLKKLLPPSTFNISFFIAIFFTVILTIIFYKTKKGKDFCLCGVAPELAKYSGIPVAKYSVLGMFLSGAFHGITGFFAVWGTFYTCHYGFYSGMGWNGLTCALIARKNPLALIPSAFLLSWIFTAADRTSMINGFSFDLENLIQGSILFFISAQFVLPKFFAKEKEKNHGSCNRLI